MSELTKGGSLQLSKTMSSSDLELAVEDTAFEKEMIEYCVSFVQMMGLPKSVGQIYGLLFSSTCSLPMDHIIQRLGISKGSASQGLNLLRGLGAVTTHSVDGDRRDYYQADLQVARIAQSFFKNSLGPRLEQGDVQIQTMLRLIETSASDDQENATRLQRVLALKKWQKRGKAMLPLITQWLKG